MDCIKEGEKYMKTAGNILKQQVQDMYYATLHAMEIDEEYRDYLKGEVERGFREKGRILLEDLDSPYRCRKGSGVREKTFDRVALLYTSLLLTENHRSNILVQRYFS